MVKTPAVRILYIEDEQPLRELFRLALETKGFLVDAAETGKRGLSTYDVALHDVVVVDYQLPDMTGIDVGRALLEKTANLPLVLITGEGSERLAIEAFTMGFSNYVVKEDESVYLELIPSVINALLKSVNETRQRIEAEKTLVEKEQQLRSIFESTSTGVISMDDEGVITMANPAILKMFGYSENELVGASISLLYPKNTKGHLDEDFKALLAKATGRNAGMGEDVERAHKDGTLIPVHLVISKARISAKTYYTGLITDLSERIRAERTRRLLELGLDNIDQALALYDKNDVLIYCNQEYRLDSDRQVRPEVVPGVKYEDLVRVSVSADRFKTGELDREAFTQTILNHHRHAGVPYELQTNDGKWMSYRELKTTDDGLVLLRQDVTEQKKHLDRTRQENEDLEWRVKQRTDELFEKFQEQKRVEDALRSSESRIRTIVESVNDGIITIDEDNIIESFNSGALDMFGYSLDEIIGKNFVELIAAPERSERRHKARKSMADRRRDTLTRPYQEIRATRKDGTVFPIEMTLNELDFGDRTRYVGSIRDLTERRAEERARREIEARFKSVVDSSPSAIMIKDVAGRFLSANAQWHKWFNPENLDISDLSLHDFHDPEAAEMLKRTDMEVILSAKPLAFEMHSFTTSDGKIHSYVQKFPILDQDGNVTAVGAMNTDISERVRAEEDRRQALIDAEKANRVKSEFLASMSHELRTPLNAILGFSEIISKQYMGPIEEPKYVSYAGDIFRSSKHLLSLVNNILDLSAVEAGAKKISKERTDVAELIEECRRSMSVVAENHQIELIVSPQDTQTSHFTLDPLAFRQILLNLLSNAVQATPVGGQIRVECHLSDNACQLTVSDNGCGIADDKLATLTLPFVRGETNPHKAQGGAGLGLSIVKSLVELHGGNLKIESQLDQGTIIIVSLPSGA